jgi:hypothetical protein
MPEYYFLKDDYSILNEMVKNLIDKVIESGKERWLLKVLKTSVMMMHSKKLSIMIVE